MLDYFHQPGKDKCDQPHVLTLSPAAIALWRDFQNDIEKQLRPEGKLSICQDWAGKISGFALRIAALLHVAEVNLKSFIITEITMRNAINIVALLTEHALAAFNLIGIDQSIEDAKNAFQWLKARDTLYFTQSDIVLAMRNKKMRKPERLQKALLILKERNIISAPVKLSTRKPTILYYINPFLKSKETS